jgi:hypothetical protein
MVLCILPYYMHTKIHMHVKIHIIIHTLHKNIRKSIRSLSNIHFNIFYIYSSIFVLHTYIHTLRLSINSIFDCVFVGSFFSQLLYLLFLFLDYWATNIHNTVVEGRVYFSIFPSRLLSKITISFFINHR